MASLTGALGAAVLFVLAGVHQGAAAEYEILAKGMKFGSAPIGSKVGDVIVWRNEDIFRHTATAADKSFDIDLPPKSVRRMTLATPGVIEYYCRFHRGMVAKLDVRQ
jgi:plastocyanin